jgi:hypothetical protein
MPANPDGAHQAGRGFAGREATRSGVAFTWCGCVAGGDDSSGDAPGTADYCADISASLGSASDLGAEPSEHRSFAAVASCPMARSTELRALPTFAPIGATSGFGLLPTCKIQACFACTNRETGSSAVDYAASSRGHCFLMCVVGLVRRPSEFPCRDGILTGSRWSTRSDLG